MRLILSSILAVFSESVRVAGAEDKVDGEAAVIDVEVEVVGGCGGEGAATDEGEAAVVGGCVGEAEVVGEGAGGRAGPALPGLGLRIGAGEVVTAISVSSSRWIRRMFGRAAATELVCSEEGGEGGALSKLARLLTGLDREFSMDPCV
jgi:hypothetical protein